MVSFSCEECGDVLTKKKLDPHRNRCHGATFTCIDCMVHFPGVQYRSHTSCMTEDQKYQGALYKEKPKKNSNNTQTQAQSRNTSSKHDSNPQPTKKTKMMAHQSYVQDVPDDASFGHWAEYAGQTEDERSPVDHMPEAPTPPPAHREQPFNVFDYLVATGQTPNASNVDLAKPMPVESQSTSLVRYEHNADGYLVDDEPYVQYGSGPVHTDAYVTPAPKTERRRSKDGDKKDKKRKRLHIEVAGDEEMVDAPPVLHSGLTGNLKSLMRFPPSPEYSGDAAEATPASPLKKSKHSKHGKSSHGHSHSIFDMITGGSKKSKKSKDKKRHRRSKSPKSPKKLEFHKEPPKTETEGQMVLFKPRADMFLGFVNKGPESDRGCSMNKALKRYHRERKSSGSSVSKVKDEKELWRSLRLRRNERGEIVVFALDDDE
ncbi:Zinc finger domain-containing protein, C2H2, LYAR-type [Cordyceps fumosorosea ARSEF 2679]|uniref:Zinc finger domain-containing protein, C2H2, LYAR-type n=1 Tax=Cordyceps fumosorosea (strain ARSEF 2679) TaxID=1081104 RepID=A0A162N1J8_CORFA|nr:Zinc finger domain-containing protein, C2H2, LYAR-type [Cordyceps fumosorosea ARSEF 2679]OAA74029.1 Zinc finger domain-containing protein, C2H2, LYAR-type [Cordyceps fumosorosea ARSEF 2679]